MPLSARFVVRSTTGLIALALLALIGIVGMTVWLAERAQVHFERTSEARDILTSAEALRSALLAAEASQRSFLLSGNEIYLAPYDAAKARAQRELTSLQGEGGGSIVSLSAILPHLATRVAGKIDEMDRTIGLKEARRDEEALAIFRTNRGKALMDEANLFLSGIVDAAEEELTSSTSELRTNATSMRAAAIAGGLAIVLIAGIIVFTVMRYTREIRQARDEVQAANEGLEERVRLRTADLAAARDRAEALLSEVNHRVANSLAIVSSMVELQAKAVTDAPSQQALRETQARIMAVAAVHQRLYSSGDVRSVCLDEYISGLVDQLAAALQKQGLGSSVRYELEPLTLKTDASVSIGVVVAEWVTNAFKYAYPQQPGEVRVRVRRLGDEHGELIVEDDGIGRGNAAPAGTGLGSRIVRAMGANIGGKIEYVSRQPGTAARLVFPIAA